MPTDARQILCVFCESTNLAVECSAARHPRVDGFGPFSTFKCNSCGSFVTQPEPTSQELSHFYSMSAAGIAPALRKSRETSPQTAWYLKCAKHLVESIDLNAAQKWLEVGSGDGELAEILAHRLPRATGRCIDFHERPARLSNIGNITWQKHDINTGLPVSFRETFDFAFTISVIEHVISPVDFVCHLLDAVKPGGFIHIVGPDYGSLLAKIMGRKWPYYLPGEHIHMATNTGIERLADRLNTNGIRLKSSITRITIPYSIRYISEFYGIPGAKLVPPSLVAPVPAGAMLWTLRKL